MRTLLLSNRITNKYRDAWRHLDKEVYLGNVQITPWKITREGVNYDDGGEMTAHVRLPVGMDKVKAMKAIKSTLSHSPCQHEHDCCGCALYHVTVKSLSKRDILVHQSVNFNY